MVEHGFLISAPQVKVCRRVLNVILHVSYSGIYFCLFLVSLLCFFPSVIGCFLAVHLPARSPLMLLLLSPGRRSPMEPAASGFEVRRRIENS